MHLMSFVSPLDRDLVLVYPRLAPVRLLRLLAEHDIAVVEVPDDGFETQGPNVLALCTPGVRLALEERGDAQAHGARRRGRRHLPGDEISRKGDSGPTCLTRPLLRA